MSKSFNELCRECETLNPVQRTKLVVDRAKKILYVFRTRGRVPGIQPTNALAAFIMGSLLSDGELNETEYAIVYPMLVEAFGSDIDFEGIKLTFLTSGEEGLRQLKQYTVDLVSIISDCSAELEMDVFMLCLLIMSMDKKVTSKERKYLKQLKFKRLNIL